MENTEEVTQHGQSRETGNTGHTRQRKKNQHNVRWTQIQITLIRHEPSYKQLEVKNEPTIVCMRKSPHVTQNVKTHNRRTQNTKKMSNTDLNDR
jgi:hypothetical protein